MVFLKKIKINEKTGEVISYSFQSLLVTYLILLLIEQIWTGFVSTYLNLNYLLIVVIILGILDVFSEHKPIKKEKPTKKDYIFISLLGILGFIIIKYKTSELGWLSWVISVIAGLLIVLLSLLVLEEDKEEVKKYKEKHYSLYKVSLFVLIGLVLISLGLGFFTQLSYLESFRIVFGSVFVLFIPGFIISYIFFPKTKSFGDEADGIDWIERIALSFALSIAIVPLAVFYLNLIGVKINLLNSSLIILGIIIISLIILYFKNKKSA